MVSSGEELSWRQGRRLLPQDYHKRFHKRDVRASSTRARFTERSGYIARKPDRAERGGFDLAAFCKLCKKLCLRLKGGNDKDLRDLVDVLFLHGFLLSRIAF